MPALIDIINGLKIKVRDCDSEPNDSSWGMQEGILISKNDAEEIIHNCNLYEERIRKDNCIKTSHIYAFEVENKELKEKINELGQQKKMFQEITQENGKEIVELELRIKELEEENNELLDTCNRYIKYAKELKDELHIANEEIKELTELLEIERQHKTGLKF